MRNIFPKLGSYLSMGAYLSPARLIDNLRYLFSVIVNLTFVCFCILAICIWWHLGDSLRLGTTFLMEHPLQVLCLKALAAFSAFLKHENISKDDVFIDFVPHFVPEFRDKLPKVKAFFILFFAVVYFRPRHLYLKYGGPVQERRGRGTGWPMTP